MLLVVGWGSRSLVFSIVLEYLGASSVSVPLNSGSSTLLLGRKHLQKSRVANRSSQGNTGTTGNTVVNDAACM